MSRWISNADVYRLTGKKRFGAQSRELDRRGIQYKPGKGGEPLVTHEAADAVDGRSAKARNSGPRWDRIGL